MVGDVAANAEKVIASAITARDELKADAVIFPELALTGYPPEDLLLRPAMNDQVRQGLEDIISAVSGIDMVLGYPCYRESRLYNAASHIRDGKIENTYFKHILPNYSVFDEKRYFTAGSEPCIISIRDIPIGLTICEDIWHPRPVQLTKKAGARLIININASPYHINKHDERIAVIAKRISETGVPVVYLNLVGGQDELVFDGESFVMDANGKVTQRTRALEEILEAVDFSIDAAQQLTPLPGRINAVLSEAESVYRTIVLGVRDYIEKNHFNGVVVGLSGGIDSALTLAIAVDAIGRERVEAVMMPSRYTSDMSIEDARQESDTLGVTFHIISIDEVFQAFLDVLQEEFSGMAADSTEENIQARCRGVVLMAISNKKGKILLTTGNKSELSVGYATLYGDMAGGFAPIKDVPKTLVYRLAAYRNSTAEVIPQRVLERAPSAELAPDQKDEDTLPPYNVLDPVLEMYIGRDMSPADIIAAGYEAAIVKRVVTMVNRNEYKRRQAPPGVRITTRAFGRDRRYPITSGFYENYRIGEKRNSRDK
jgi:NAD+ synthase (glutamine-hydrolysing)